MNYAQLPKNVEVLKAIIADHLAHIAHLEEQVRLLKALRFLAASEKANPTRGGEQYSLFDEAELAAPEGPALTEAEDVVVVATHAGARRAGGPSPRSFPA